MDISVTRAQRLHISIQSHPQPSAVTQVAQAIHMYCSPLVSAGAAVLCGDSAIRALSQIPQPVQEPVSRRDASARGVELSVALDSRVVASPESQKTVILVVVLSSIRFSTNRAVAFRGRVIQERGVTDLHPA